VDYAAWRHGVRVVVHGEDPAEDVGADAERVPEAGGHAAELLAVRGTPEDVAALAAAGKGRTVRAGELVVGAEVFAQAEVEVSLRVEGEPREAVVRVVPLGVEEDDALPLVGLAVALRVARRRISLRVAT